MLALWTQCDRLAPGRPGPLEGEAEKAAAGRLRHHLDALHHAGNDLVLDGGVQVLGQLADDQDVHALEAGRQAAEVLERPHRGEQAQLAAELHVEIAALGAPGGDSSLVFRASPFVATDSSIGWRQGRLALLERGQAGQVLVPVDGDAGRLENALDGRHLVEPDAAALHQRHAQAHGFLQEFPSARSLPRSVCLLAAGSG